MIEFSLCMRRYYPASTRASNHLNVENIYCLRKSSKFAANCFSVYMCKCKFISKMSTNAKVLASIAVLLELKNMENKENYDFHQKAPRKVKNRRCWVRPFLLKRTVHDVEAHLLKDLLWEDDEEDFKNFSRLNVNQFEEILNLVHGSIKKMDTCMRAAIPPRTKLAITLRYLASGDSFKSLEFLTRVSKKTISAFIPIVLRAIYEALKNQYIKVPDKEEEWEKIAEDFNYLWQFPHVLGALYGKHIRIKTPSGSGSQFYNFKGYHSIILFASVDAHCRFTFIDVGCYGKSSDSTIYQDVYLYNALQNGYLNIPKATELIHGQGSKIPYVFIGDDAFKLDKNLMKPYSRSTKLSVQQEIFNYRLSRARMVVECTFGRLAKRFNIFNRPIEVIPSSADLIVLTSCVLHNYLTKIKTTPMSIDFEADGPPKTFSSIGLQQSNSYKYVCRIRDELSNYFTTNGSVDFQWKKLRISPS